MGVMMSKLLGSKTRYEYRLDRANGVYIFTVTEDAAPIVDPVVHWFSNGVRSEYPLNQIIEDEFGSGQNFYGWLNEIYFQSLP